jgi:hypothetical protein
VTLIFISLRANDAEQIFTCFWHHLHNPYCKMSPPHVLCPFPDWMFIFKCFESSFYTVEVSPLSDTSFANIFFHSVDIFHSLNRAFHIQSKILNFDEEKYVLFFKKFYGSCFCCCIKKFPKSYLPTIFSYWLL